MSRCFRRTGLAAGLIRVALAVSTVRADAPASRYVVDAGTVTDTKTMLVWERSPDPMARSYSAAERYCATLTLAGGGWRLPGIKELVTLVDATRYDPAIDTGVFPNTMSKLYWSKSAVTTVGGLRVWAVDFHTGGIGFIDTSSPHPAHCVR